MSVSLVLAALALSPAHAWNDSGQATYTSACEITCETGGFTVEVLESDDNDNVKLRMWPSSVVQIRDSAHHAAGDTYLGHQSVSSPLAGGPYCESYPGSGGLWILGAIWERTLPSTVDYAETGDLYAGAVDHCGAGLNYLLNTLDVYATNPTIDIPAYCGDFACGDPSVGGGGDDNPFGGGAGSTLLSAEDLQDLLDLFGSNDGSNDDGGATPAKNTRR